MLQQPSVGVFVQALELRVYQPDVRNAPAAVVFQAVRDAIAIVGETISTR